MQEADFKFSRIIFYFGMTKATQYDQKNNDKTCWGFPIFIP